MAEESSAIVVGGRNACTPHPLSAVSLLDTYLFCLRTLLEVARGVHYIHSEGVVHGDLRGVFRLNHSIIIFDTLTFITGQRPPGRRISSANMRFWIIPTFRCYSYGVWSATSQLFCP